MSHLVLELRQGDTMVVNGATIRFRNRCRVELVSQARFLFGKQIMAPEDACSNLQRLYYGLQMAYAGAPDEQQRAEAQVPSLLAQLRQDMPAEGTVFDDVESRISTRLSRSFVE
jgi:flagellar biosynthesis repressor protein FlbT